MISIQKAILVALLAVSFGSSVSFAADEELKSQGISYACTGVAESKEDPRWKAYPAKFVFAAAGGAFVADVNVTIRDASGASIFQATCDAPWLVVRLNPGSYQVEASVSGSTTQKAQIKVGSQGQAQHVFRFSSVHEK